MCACACVCTRQSRLQQLVDLHRAEIHEIQSQAEVFGTFRLPILSLYFVQNCHQLVVKQHVHPGVDMSPSGRRPPRPHTRGRNRLPASLSLLPRLLRGHAVLFLAESATLRVMTAQRGYSDERSRLAGCDTLVKAAYAVPHFQ